MLTVEEVSVHYNNLTILDKVSFTVQENQWLMLVGPNGAGKSTIINAVTQGVPYTGKVTYKGQDVAKIKPLKLARHLGVLRQNYHIAYPFTVGEIVRLGRYAYTPGIFSKTQDNEEKLLYNALELTGMLPLINQSVLTLSGGELQRTFLAQIFAQDPELLILDEPTNHLDLVFQQQIFELIDEWVKQPGRAVMSVVHDLSLARKYGTDAILLDKGKMAARGKTKTVLNKTNLQNVYSIDVFDWMEQMFSQWKE